MTTLHTKTYCGFISILGRPNVGKSTLLNQLIGEKICITSNKPQTTRDRILGIKTLGARQIIFMDTPGIHSNEKKPINRVLNKIARQSLSEADLILFVIEAQRWTHQEDLIVRLLQTQQIPILMVINKIDLCHDKAALAAFFKSCHARLTRAIVLTISAKKSRYLSELQDLILARLPERAFYFYPDVVTDRDEFFRIREFIREQLFRKTAQELPYATAVHIERKLMKKTAQNTILHFYATIWVERESQKKIIIGHEGQQLKIIGQAARKQIERYLKQQIYLNLWVKVKANWSENKNLLQQLSFNE